MEEKEGEKLTDGEPGTSMRCCAAPCMAAWVSVGHGLLLRAACMRVCREGGRGREGDERDREMTTLGMLWVKTKH
jgi:hypothetical protein